MLASSLQSSNYREWAHIISFMIRVHDTRNHREWLSYEAVDMSNLDIIRFVRLKKPYTLNLQLKY